MCNSLGISPIQICDKTLVKGERGREGDEEEEEEEVQPGMVVQPVTPAIRDLRHSILSTRPA